MVGARISHYRIEQELGRGGMGVVYRAQDERLQRPVALKLLSDTLACKSDSRNRILAEGRAASALNHPGITTIYEVGEDGDQIFIVMELISGQTLRAVILEGPCEMRTLTRLGAQVAETLAVAHAHGIVHGDVKPENVVVQADGRVKLLDFGIARQVAAETLTLTSTSGVRSWVPESQIAGTIAYMAPEQLLGAATDARADLFSLGIMLYEMAAGLRPFVAPTVSGLISQIVLAPHAPLPSVVPTVPADLAHIINKLLEKKPESRYQSAREIAVDLTNLARDLEVGAVLPAAVTGKRAIAVLPFKLLTPHPEDEYLSAALADAVINQLSGLPDLLVRPTSTVMRYAKQSVDPLFAARELNVQVVVDGSIQKSGTKLRVHIQARNANDGTSLLSAKHDSEMTDLFGLQDTIAESLARALGTKTIDSGTVATPPTKNSMAYELYLRALDRLAHLNRWDTRTAIEMLDNALQLDPRFADAWARLAQACWQMGAVFEPGPTWIKRADRAIRKALALDRNNAEAIAARGQVLWTAANGFQNRAALRALGDALRVNPGCLRASAWRGCIFMHVGLLEDARRGLTEALASNPDDPFTLVFLGQTNLYSGKYDQALEYHDRAIAVDASNIWANIFAPTMPLYQRDLAKAEHRIKNATQVLGPDPMLVACEGLLNMLRGERRKAEQLTLKALSTARKPLSHTHHMWHLAAATYALLEKPVPALNLLKKCIAVGLPNYPAFRDDPHFIPLQKHPQFLRLMTDLKKEWHSYQKEFSSEQTGRFPSRQ
jgi:serine/threonine protein kinase/tetratricopeptide (TPR) repeat protein